MLTMMLDIRYVDGVKQLEILETPQDKGVAPLRLIEFQPWRT